MGVDANIRRDVIPVDLEMMHRTQLSVGGAIVVVRYGTVDADLLVHNLVSVGTARLITGYV